MDLRIFSQIKFLSALKALFKDLKVPMNYVADEPTTAKEILKDTITKENLQDEGIPCLNYEEIHSKYGFAANFSPPFVPKCPVIPNVERNLSMLTPY